MQKLVGVTFGSILVLWNENVGVVSDLLGVFSCFEEMYGGFLGPAEKKQEVAAATQVVPAATQEVAAEMQEEAVPVFNV